MRIFENLLENDMNEASQGHFHKKEQNQGPSVIMYEDISVLLTERCPV
jgi:hypothetical protein